MRKSRPFRLSFANIPASMKRGLAEVERLFPERFGKSGPAYAVGFQSVPAGKDGLPSVSLAVEEGGVLIRHTDSARAFRALGRLMGRLASGKPPEPFTETASFSLSGIMLDCSRNAVPTVEKTREWIVRMALMGLDTLLLYMEDTYEVPDEPFFGYGRGRFTPKELKALDDFAFGCGVEMIPCIQTLGHMEQALRWPAYRDLRDQPDVLLADEPKTYALLEKMIRAASAPVRSKRIHIGMDEAHGVGLGRYRDLHGETPRFELMLRHLGRVRDLCAQRGLTPWIWSDMFFRLGSKTNDYYDTEAALPPGLAEKIPAGARLVYWDYYHQDKEFYRDFIRRHRSLGSEPLVALGAWSWSRFWPALPYAENTIRPCMEACRAEGARETFLTVWGDDGTECDLTGAWPAMQFYAEFVYSDRPSETRARENFLGSAGGDRDRWRAASRIDNPPGYPPAGKTFANPSKVLLWQDPMLAFNDPPAPPEKVAAHYAGAAAAILADAKRSGRDRPLALPALVADAVAKKIVLRHRASRLMRRKDMKGMDAFLKKELPAAQRAVQTLWKCHRSLWMANNKPNGWEILEARYGCLLARLETMRERLLAWRKDGAAVPELAETLLPLPVPGERHSFYQYIASPGVCR